MGAGLGAVHRMQLRLLIVLNQLWQCELSEQQLADYGVKLGADVPIFVLGRNAWAEGIGEHLSFIDLAQKKFIILKPDCFYQHSTAFFAKNIDKRF